LELTFLSQPGPLHARGEAKRDMKTALILILYAVSSSFGLALIKASMNNIRSGQLLLLLSSVLFWAGGFLYILGFVIWFMLLKQNSLSTIFPVAAGSLVISTAMLGHLMLHEVVTYKGVAGIVLIVSGIVLLNLK
jgi:drug/metabolite transporter (DMT)-like permease